MGRNTLDAIAVVVPAHNEADHVDGCLRSLGSAMERFASTHPEVLVTVTFVLDSCTDKTSEIIQRHGAADPRIAGLCVQHRNVGASRAAGVRHAVNELAPLASGGSLWVACTDADTRVPEHWLDSIARYHAAGADAVTGTVEPDRRELDPGIFALWQAAYRPVEGHHHIHGANFAVSAAAYEAVGGFEPLEAGEDIALVSALRQAGYRVDASASLHAVTSGRLRGRLREGFADYLATLAGHGTRVGSRAGK